MLLAGSQTFTVQTTEDTIDEGTGETFTVAISSPTGGGGPAPSLGTSKSVTTTITDDDDAPSGIVLSASPSSLGEDDGATSITVTATLSGGTTRTSATVVTIGTLAGSATKDTDYAATTLASITIPANKASGSGTLTITPTDDTVVEGDETITIPGTTTTQVGLTVSSATVTLTDDDKSTSDPGEEDDKDSAELSISGPASNVSEGGNAVFTVTLSAAIAKEVQVAWSAPLTADAAEAADLGTTSGTVTFAAGSEAGVTRSITITATDDALSETAESFTVTLGTITSTLSSQVSLKSDASSATATISESDPITISLTGPTSVNEGDATMAYTVSLSPPGVTPTADLTVSYATSNGTATAGSDYTAKSGTLTFTQTAAGSQTFTVQTTEDAIDEGAGETFTVTISSPSGGGGPSPSVGTSSVSTTITDDDNAPTGITLSASPDTLGEDDAATSVTVTATLNGGTTRASATVVTIGTLAGTATKDTDYAATTLASITIPANTASATGSLTITPTDDQVVEGDETITIPGTTTVTGLNVSDAIVTLTDDDKSTPTPGDKDSAELSITGPTSNVSEGSDATFTVTLSKAVAAAVQVAWSAPLDTDSAVGADLSATSGTVTFAANSAAGATQSITITATDDALSETAETFTVTLGTITATLSSQISLKTGAKSAQATISASDPITVSISGPTGELTEGDVGTYTVSLSPSGVTPTSDLTVSYATADGTAVAGSDYTDTSGTLTFTQADAGNKTFTVQTTEDILAEDSESFTVTISSPTGGGGQTPSLGSSSSVTTTIEDDDFTNDPPEDRQDLRESVDIWLTVSPDSVNEGAGSTNFTVTAEHAGDPQSDPVTIQLALRGTATMGSTGDYTAPATASVTIPANQTGGQTTLNLNILDDTEVEGDETIIVGGSSGQLVIQSAVITIHDDESTYLSITGPAADVAEGSSASFTVTLSKTVAADVTVAWSAAAGTAETADLGASSRSGSVTFPANSAAGATQTITVAVTDDNLSEGSETFSVTLGADTGTEAAKVWVKSTAASAEATIAESDPITVSITGPSSVDEGDAISNYTVSLSPTGVTPTADLTVSYSTSNGTATAGTDYTAKSGTLTFTSSAAGSQTFTVQTTEDKIDEGTGEIFTVTISSPSGGGGPAPILGTSKSVTTTITDDDTSGITLSVSPSSVKENDDATDITVTATLNGGITRAEATVVTIGTLSGTATKDTDYSVTTALASITIPANSANATGTLTLDPTDDDVVEGHETITIPGTTTVTGLDVTSATVTLTDHSTDQKKDSAELSISGPTSTVDEGDDATFTVTLSKAVAAEVQVAWSAPLAADAAEDADLSATSGTVTFAANSVAGATRSITITATDDALSETAESFTVTLGTITSDLSSQVSVDTSAGSATATISASDPITVSISGPASVNEGDATTNYTVSLSPAGVTPTADLTVSYATAGGTAEAGTDYTAKSGTLTFTSSAAGSQTFTVETTEDILAENSEDFTVTISSPTGGGGPTPSLGTSSVTTAIRDNDAVILSPSDPSDVDIQLTVAPASVNEGAGSTNFTVTATHDDGSTRGENTVITLSLGGTAGSSDYTGPTSASVTIPANQTSGQTTLTLNILNDTETEGDETIIVGGASGDLVIRSAVITIHDDDAPISTGPTNPPLAPRPPPSPTPTPTPTPKATPIPTPTPEATPTPTPTPEATPIPTPTPEATPTPTPTPEATPIPTPTPEATPTPTPTPEATPIPTPTPEPTPISTPGVTPTPTSTPEATSTPIPTPTPKATPVPAPRTGTGPARGRLTPTPTPTPEATPTPTPTPEPRLVRETLPGLGSGMGNGSANGTMPTPVPGTTPVPKLATVSMLTTETTSRSSWDSNGAVKSNGTGDPTPTASPAQSMLPLSGLSLLPWWIILLIALLIAIAIRITRRLMRREDATSGLLSDRTS